MQLTVELDENTYGALGVMAQIAGGETIEALVRALITIQAAGFQKALETRTLEELLGLSREIFEDSPELWQVLEVAHRRTEAVAGGVPAGEAQAESAPGGPPVFRCEDSLWQMLADGTKTFDTRKYDMADERIYPLAWTRKPGIDDGVLVREILGDAAVGMDSPGKEGFEPLEKQVSFLNKATGQLLTFQYLGMEFHPRMPGWCILVLGERVATPPVKEGQP